MGIRHSKCASSFVLDLRRKQNKTTTVIAVKLTVFTPYLFCTHIKLLYKIQSLSSVIKDSGFHICMFINSFESVC